LNLEEIREEISEVDARILELIVRRVALAQDVLAAKTELQVPIDDPRQNGKVLDRATDIAVESGLDVEPVREIFKILIRMNQERQLKLSTESGIG